jgi:hypothetical protein
MCFKNKLKGNNGKAQASNGRFPVSVGLSKNGGVFSDLGWARVLGRTYARCISFGLCIITGPSFDVYDEDNDLLKCYKSNCIWLIKQSGPCKVHPDEKHDECISWP